MSLREEAAAVLSRKRRLAAISRWYLPSPSLPAAAAASADPTSASAFPAAAFLSAPVSAFAPPSATRSGHVFQATPSAGDLMARLVELEADYKKLRAQHDRESGAASEAEASLHALIEVQAEEIALLRAEVGRLERELDIYKTGAARNARDLNAMARTRAQLLREIGSRKAAAERLVRPRDRLLGPGRTGRGWCGRI